MTDNFVPGYYHRQSGPLALLLYAVGVAFFAAIFFLHDDQVATIALAAGGVVMLVMGTSIHHLTVKDDGDRLAVRFGPLPLFRTSIRYADMQSADVDRTLLLDGWGVHYSIRGGWVWNIWGRSCVVVVHGSTSWLGTDDAENLSRFLKSRIATRLETDRQAS